MSAVDAGGVSRVRAELLGDRGPVEVFATSARAAARSRRRAAVVAQQPDDRPAKVGGSSARIRCSPCVAGSPSAPIVVETTAVPMAIASKILSRVPPPIRSGTTYTAASRRYGRTSATRPVTATPRPSASPCTARRRRSRPTIVSVTSGSVGTESAGSRCRRDHPVLVRQPVHRPGEDELRGRGSGPRPEEVRVDAGRHDRDRRRRRVEPLRTSRRSASGDGQHAVESATCSLEAPHPPPLLPI